MMMLGPFGELSFAEATARTIVARGGQSKLDVACRVEHNAAHLTFSQFVIIAQSIRAEATNGRTEQQRMLFAMVNEKIALANLEQISAKGPNWIRSGLNFSLHYHAQCRQ